MDSQPVPDRLSITAPLQELADDPSTIRMPQREARRQPSAEVEPLDLSGAITSEIDEPDPTQVEPPGDAGRALPFAPPGERRVAKTIIGVGDPEFRAELKALYERQSQAGIEEETRARRPEGRTLPPFQQSGGLDPDITLPNQPAPEPRTSPAEMSTGPVKPARLPHDLNLSEHVKAAKATPAGRAAPVPKGMIPFDDTIGDHDKTVPAGAAAKTMQHQEADALSSTDKLAAFDVGAPQKGPIDALSSTDRLLATLEEDEEPPPLPDDATSPAAPAPVLLDEATSPAPAPPKPGDTTSPALPPLDNPVTFDPAPPLVRSRPAAPARAATVPAQPLPMMTSRAGPSNLVLILLWVVAAVSVGVAVFLYAR